MLQMSATAAPFKIITQIDQVLAEIPEDSIVSRTVWKSEQVKAVLFGFDTGQALSDHSASQAAIIHVLEGEAHITLESEVVEAQPGTWLYLPARMTHSVTAHTPTKLLLLLFKE